MSECDRCRKSFTRGMIILRDSSGLEHHVCRDCYNKELAGTLGIDNYNDFIKTYQAKDAEGEIHVFEIQKEIFPFGLSGWRMKSKTER